uniref:Peptidase S8/S53 domain-containing protein n=1 Tax=Oryza glumipatula TaxID=40148 RepID=A0A0E0BHH1_9ORYZ
MGFFGFGSAPTACALIFAVILALHGPCFALPEAPGEAKELYIVYLGERQHEDADLVTASHHTMLATVLGSEELASESIVYSYKHGFSGFSAMLTESQARNIRGLPGVANVWMNQMHNVVTTRSWDFMGLPYNQTNGLLAHAKMGDGIIIGVIDSGIWPESPSFDDTGYAPPAAKWKGICQSGMSFTAKSCNRKIIGARWYADDFNKSQLEAAGEFLSPRDFDGHGTHVASTAAGSVVRNVSFYGLASGVAQGGAPKAHIAVYKACWSIGCSEATIFKAIDDAIHDGVDILSLSILSPTGHAPAFHAVVKGIPVIYAAGNDGPYTQTVNSVAPWLLTVAASTMDRLFPTVVTLGDGQTLVGQSLFVAARKANQFHKLKLYYNDMCNLTIANSTDVKGNIILCSNLNAIFTTTQLVELATALVKSGGKGFIFTQRSSDRLATWQFQALTIPIVSVDLEVAFRIHQYFSTTQSPLVKVSPSQTTTGRGIPAPKMAAFSSRGPSFIYPTVLKPDIAAPGVNILAAVPPVGKYKKLGLPYFFNSGTSMACPHVSGIVALLKSLHPDWSPAALKSAIMTTAHITDNNGLPLVADATPNKIADPFDYGAGFVNPTKASDPGLIYDIDPSDYQMLFNCMIGSNTNRSCTAIESSLFDLNLPSIAIPNLKTSQTISRTVTNVGQPDAMYKAFLQPPAGVDMLVKPKMLVFDKNTRSQCFKVTFKARQKFQGDYTFGSLAWHDGSSHWVRIPIAIRVVIEDFYSTKVVQFNILRKLFLPQSYRIKSKELMGAPCGGADSADQVSSSPAAASEVGAPLLIGSLFFSLLRYGERTWALKCGSRNGLRETSWQLPKLNVEVDKGSYIDTICYVLQSILCVHDLFSGRTISQMKERQVFRFQGDRPLEQVPKLLEIELAMMSDDLYTKAMVLQTRSGIILRFISHVFMIAAFVLFLIASNKQQYKRVDIAITYVLFIGGFVLDVCSFFLVAMSPWTWAFFRAQNCNRLAHISWLILCSCIGWPEKKPLWSSSMGQYNFLSSSIGFDESRSSSKMFTILRKMLNAVNKKLWFRKIWHIKHVKVDKDIMDIMVTWVGRLAREEFTRITQQQSWANLRPIINCTLNIPANSFGDNIVLLHIYTDLHLRKQPDNEAIGAESETASSSTADIMDICRKISNYIVYLLVAQPSMLPLSGAADDTTAAFHEKISKKGSSKQDVLETCYQLVEDQLEFGYEECLKEQEQPGPWRETLMEIRDMWLRLLIYIAGKCQVELHAQQLGRGGELLTFVWLLMAHHDIGDVAHQVDLITSSETMSGQFCAFHFPKEPEQ